MASKASHILEFLSAQRQVVAADWRVHVLLARMARQQNARIPDISVALRTPRQLVKRGDFAPIEGVQGVYRVVTPFARHLPAPDEAVAQEANPFAVFSFLSAMYYHGLMDEVARALFVTEYPANVFEMIPQGTTPDDWLDVPRPRRRRPARIGKRAVHWTRTKPEWAFGATVGLVQGNSVYVTDLERTLVDTLRFPDKCGGVLEVVQAWARAREDLGIDKTIRYTQRIGQGILRQRVGFMLEQLDLHHADLDAWAARSKRGGSSKLFGNREFASTYSERWNLSLNAPESTLRLLSERS